MAYLCEVKDEREVSKLQDKMSEYLPESVGIQGFLDMIIKCQLREIIDVKVFVPNGVGDSSLVVITPSCTQYQIQSMMLFWDTEKENDEDILHLLKSLPDWDWSAPVYVRVCPVSVFQKIQEYMKSGGLGNSQMSCSGVFEGYLYALDSSSDVHYEIPEGFFIDCLRAEDAPGIVNRWALKFPETQRGVEDLVAKLPSVALRRRQNRKTSSSEDPLHGDLASLCFMFPLGVMGNLYTLPEYRRQGLGKVVTLAMAERLRARGLSLYSVVEGFNNISVEFHEKLGFKRECDVRIFVMLPSGTKLAEFIK